MQQGGKRKFSTLMKLKIVEIIESQVISSVIAERKDRR